MLKCVGICVVPLNSIIWSFLPYFKNRGIRALHLTASSRAEVCALLRGQQGSRSEDEPVLILTHPEELLHPTVLAALRPPPEAVDEAAILRLLLAGSPAPKSPVGIFVVDEAHIVAMWGHTFRPLYARIGEAVEALRVWPGAALRLVALTATASPEERMLVLRLLGFGLHKPVHLLLYSTRRTNTTFRFSATSARPARSVRAADVIAHATCTGTPC